MKKQAFAALAALLAFGPAYAVADENPFAKDTVVLQLKDLDLTTADGQRRLAIRLDQATRAVCGDQLSTVHLALDEQARSCRTQIAANVRSQIEARNAAAAASKLQLASSR